MVLLACGWFGCSGSEVSSGNGVTGGSGGAAGSAGSAGTAKGGSGGSTPCLIDCANPPPGCSYVGQPTCDPPACPPMVCNEAGPDAPCQIDCGAPPPGCHFEGEATCNPPKCPPIVCDDAGPDALDGSLPPFGDFPSYLEGVWLIGWSGGMNHYSWVRIAGAPNFNGDAVFLAGTDLLANTPFWDCSGPGTWMLTQKPYTVGFYFPTSCTSGFEAYTFLSFEPPIGGPPNANLHATIEGLTPNQPLEGWRFPSDQCDPGMNTCKSPWP